MLSKKEGQALTINLFGGPGVGKCFRKGTEVLMFDGSTKKVENVIMGDNLMGPDSKPRTVIGLSKGSAELFEVKPIKGESHYTTGNHILPLKLHHHGIEKDEYYSVEQFLNLSKWRKKRLKLCRSSCIEFKERNVPIDPYFIGCWLGDGNNANQGITSIDKEIINYLSDLAHTFGMHVNEVSKTGTLAVRIDITNGQCGGRPNAVLNILRDLNLLHNKHIPELYKINSRNNRLKLLAGLIDTDGSITNGCFEIITKYKKLSSDIQFLCRSLGLAAYERIKVVNGTDYYRIFISGHLDSIPVKLKRKKASKRNKLRSVLRTGLTVNPVGYEEFYGFEVNADHLFLLSDFTVTHNSTTAAGVFTLLKLHDIECELVTEFAKDLVWEERSRTFGDQHYIFGKQHHRMWRLHDKVDVMITDSPLMLSTVYRADTYAPSFEQNVVDTVCSYDNINFVINRTKKYNMNGRNETESQARAVDEKIKAKLLEYDMMWIDVMGNFKGINAVADAVLAKLGIKMEFRFDMISK